MDEKKKKPRSKIYHKEISLLREDMTKNKEKTLKTFREREIIIFKASGIRMTDVSMAFLNLEEQGFAF